jgi:hypothetical protein
MYKASELDRQQTAVLEEHLEILSAHFTALLTYSMEQSPS